MTDATAQCVAQHVLDWFRTSSVCQKKHPVATEWTVLAGIVLRVNTDANNDSFRVLACGTGTKCLGRRDLNEHGLVVNDCHAEIVTRRALVRYLYQEALLWKRQEAPPSSIFERKDESGKLRLKSGHSLHLYISEAPCGDAAIYPLQEQVVDAMVRQRQQRDVDTSGQNAERSEFRLTGAKVRSEADEAAGKKRPRDENASEPSEKRFEQSVGVARVKSGRSDLPHDKQTLSMSCSDKLAKWHALGIQGTLLLQWFDPIFLSSIAVSGDSNSVSVDAQQRALERAIQSRLPRGMAANDRPIQLCVLPDALFDRNRTPDKAPSPLSINWAAPQPGSNTNHSTLKAFFESKDVEVLMGATGFKQGAKKASKMDRTAREKVASRLCKWQFYRAYHHILEGDINMPYNTQKDQLRSQLEPWKTRSEHFRQAIGEWIGVPATYKAFTLSSSLPKPTTESSSSSISAATSS